MPFKAAKPEVSASAHASSSSSAAQRFYSDDQAATYTTPANASIQRDLSLYALELAHVMAPIIPSSHTPFVLLDLGAGSGLSTRAASTWLTQRGVNAAFAIAFDISAAMLSLTAGGDDRENSRSHDHNDHDHNHVAVKDDGRKTLKSVACGDRSAFYCGNAAQKFPLRAKTCDLAIGISMLQWLTDDGLLTCYRSLYDVLQDQSAAVFQIYPTSPDQVVAMETIARQVGFTYAEVVASFPHATMAKKWFLVLKKSNGTAAAPPLDELVSCRHLCQFGRRHHRRCAWHLLQGSSDATTLSLRERLGREHVKNAWHVWRKFHRAATLAKQALDTQAQGDGVQDKPLHFKAKRSLELWKSDEMIGEALRDRFVVETIKSEDASTTTAITYNFLLENMDDVVNVVHKAYSEAVALERSLAQPPLSTEFDRT